MKDLLPPSVRVAHRALRAWRNGEAELHLLPQLCSRNLWSIDVGANNGVYTWHLARLSAGVTAFEPQAEHAPFLARAFGRRATIEQVALSDAPGEALLRIPLERHADGRATIEPQNTLARSVSRQCTVPRRCLDSYDLPPVGLIKIDVEGHELAVLRGAVSLLARDRPHLLIEAEERHRPGALESVCGFLSPYGYRPHVCQDGGLRALDAGALVRATAPAQGVNFVFPAPGRAPPGPG